MIEILKICRSCLSTELKLIKKGDQIDVVEVDDCDFKPLWKQAFALTRENPFLYVRSEANAPVKNIHWEKLTSAKNRTEIRSVEAVR